MALTTKEILALRATRDSNDAKTRAAQYDLDIQAIYAYETENSCVLDISQEVTNLVDGCPVVVGIRVPTELEYKRFFQKINRTGAPPEAKAAAHVELSETCWVYPSNEEARKKMCASNPGLLACVGNIANRSAELQSAESGKG